MFNRVRNIKKRWFVVTAAVALLSVGLISGAVFAANGPPGLAGGPYFGDYDGHRAGKDSGQVLARVAEIIGVEPETLEAAFKTALDEQAQTNFDARIDALTADETLTQEQADAAKAWFADRPELSGPLALRLSYTADAERVANGLQKLVDAGKLTQEQADALSAWHAERPDALPEAKRHHKGHRKGHHDGDRNGHHDDDDDGDGQAS